MVVKFLFNWAPILYHYTHRCGIVVAATYTVDEVSGSIQGRVILKTLKIIPTAALFGAVHIRVRVRAIITLSRKDLQSMD